MRRILVIANAQAGGGDDDTTDTVEQVLSAAADVTVVRPGDPSELTAAIADRDGREVAVLGGDGSLHLVVQTLYDRGELDTTPLGLVPLGTGNDFARTMDLPLDPGDAAQVIAAGRLRRLDIMVDADGGVVVNAVHVGVGAEAGKESKDLKPRLGKLAYAAGAAVAGARTQGWRLGVAVDGRVVNDRRTRVLMVGVGNGVTVGGGTKLAPDARPDDGLVDVVVSRSLGPAARVAYAAQMAVGRHVNRDDVVAVRGREVRIAGDRVPVNTDGELGDAITHQSWRVVPGAWQLYVPADSGA